MAVPIRLRWKKHPHPKGLWAVGHGPRSSDLWDGQVIYATVSPLGGDWRRPLQGWYWVSNSTATGALRNASGHRRRRQG
jgi:hypothetical protein